MGENLNTLIVTLKLNLTENANLEKNALIQKKMNQFKTANLPSAKMFPQKLIAVLFLVILISLIIGGSIIWDAVYISSRESTTEQPPFARIQQRISSGEISPKIQSKKSILLDYFRRISNYTIPGIFLDSVRNSQESVGKFQEISGVSPGIICTEMPSYTSTVTEWASFVDEVITNWNNRHLVRILWRRGNPLDQSKRFTVSINKADTQRRWRDLINNKGGLNKLWKEELDGIAPYLHELQDAGVVPIFDIFPVINHATNIWRGRPGINGSAKLFQITRNYLTEQHNLTSLIWNWSLHSFAMSHFEQFWPGNDYVDVASVVMWDKKAIQVSEYERLLNLVGDKPLSMEWIWTVPSVNLLRAQSRWTWFTTSNKWLEDKYLNNARTMTTFNSTILINNENITTADFFRQDNFNK